jgi:hypothetical protein
MEIGTIPTSLNYFIEGRHGELCVLAVKSSFVLIFVGVFKNHQSLLIPVPGGLNR